MIARNLERNHAFSCQEELRRVNYFSTAPAVIMKMLYKQREKRLSWGWFKIMHFKMIKTPEKWKKENSLLSDKFFMSGKVDINEITNKFYRLFWGSKKKIRLWDVYYQA